MIDKKWYEYERYICKKMGFSKSVWRAYAEDIEQIFGEYDPEIKYAGRGDSDDANESISSKIVPELYDNFIYYVHDGFYHLIKYTYGYGFFKPKADKIMKLMMQKKGAKILDDIYYFFVRCFG